MPTVKWSGGLRSALLCVPLLLTWMSTPSAMTIHYDASRDEALRACDQIRYRGEDVEARVCFEALLDADGVLVRADAAAALGDVRRANRLYREASESSRDPAVSTHWARLYLETHQLSDAEALFREALVFDPDHLPATLGLAEAQASTFEGRARETLVRITIEHPDNVKALVLLAKLELEVQNLLSARGLLNRALREAETQGWPPLEMYALMAGAELLEGKSMTPWVDKALAYNPSYGDVHAIPAHFYIITYRYREAVDLYQKAVALSPDLAPAHRDLGINLLRINQVFGARYHLERAYQIDPFDVQTVNTLKLLDSLDDMRISRVDVVDPDDPDRYIGRALVRLDREDADALEPYVIELIELAMQSFDARYDFQLEQPMVVELYHDHDDFGVRTVSTPGIGLLGVTFGYLTAMDSPKARAPGEFHWGTTLWHEIAHVYTLEATNHQLPRWLSEGLSVYEEWNTGPLADREIPLDTLAAFKADRFLPIENLDSGFVRPTYQGQVNVSYMQAGLICDFIAQRHEHAALVTMLKAFGRGESTAVALEAATGLGPAEFDAQFNEYMRVTYGELLAGLDDFRAASRQMGRAMELEDWLSVEALARDVIRRYPARVGRGNAYEVLAEAHRQQDEPADATATLVAWHERGGHEPETLQRLAAELMDLDRPVEAAAVIESLNWVMPYLSEEHRWLGDHYLANDQATLAVREFNALLGLQPEDPAAAHLGKARAAFQLDDRQTARRQVLYALENAPFYRPAQRLLLELKEGDRVD